MAVNLEKIKIFEKIIIDSKLFVSGGYGNYFVILDQQYPYVQEQYPYVQVRRPYILLYFPNGSNYSKVLLEIWHPYKLRTVNLEMFLESAPENIKEFIIFNLDYFSDNEIINDIL